MKYTNIDEKRERLNSKDIFGITFANFNDKSYFYKYKSITN